MLRAFITGFFMGFADLVPGVSGGTVAFISGLYDKLITNISLLRPKCWHAVDKTFLFSLFFGILMAMATLSHGIHFLLGQSMGRACLFSAFIGLIAASFGTFIQKVSVWTPKCLILLICSTFLAFILSAPRDPPEAPYAIAYSNEALAGQSISNLQDGKLTQISADALGVMLSKGWVQEDTEVYKGTSTFQLASIAKKASLWSPWLTVVGFLGATAMLLPGVSGSYVLLLLGAYVPVIAAVSDFMTGLKTLHIDPEASSIILSVGLGVVLGLLFASRMISWCLKHYFDPTLAALSGLMLGGIRALWPFWSYKTVLNPIKMLPQLEPLNMTLPNVYEALMAIFIASTSFALIRVLLRYAALAEKRVKV